MATEAEDFNPKNIIILIMIKVTSEPWSLRCNNELMFEKHIIPRFRAFGYLLFIIDYYCSMV